MTKQLPVKHTQLASLPSFAWGAIYNHDTLELEVFHGKGVEQSADGTSLVEGAWNGKFTDFDFCQSSVFCGTGLTRLNGELLFSSSTDGMAALFSIRKDEHLYISKSAIFAISLADAKPHPLYPFYNHDVLKVFRGGLHDPAGETRLADGRTLRIHVCTIVAIKPNGEIEYRIHPAGEVPDGFDHYRNILTNSIAEVLKNGKDPMRKCGFESAAAISTGYDSCTTASLARDAGCTVAHTFYDTKLDDPHADSGARNAAALGMECREYDRWAYLKSNTPIEAEFSLITSGGNATLLAMEKDLQHRIYIVGSHGEISWGLTRIAYFGQLGGQWRRSISNISQVEYRLRIGYIVFAPALIALRHNQAIAKISHDTSMQPWSIGGEYNRPISRRICEEAGIPRDQFGIKKYAGGHSNLSSRESFSDVGDASYSDFLDRQTKDTPTLLLCYWKARFFITNFVYYKLTSKKRKSAHSTPLRRKFPFILNAPPQRYPWKYAFTFQWAFDELKHRYQTK